MALAGPAEVSGPRWLALSEPADERTAHQAGGFVAIIYPQFGSIGPTGPSGVRSEVSPHETPRALVESFDLRGLEGRWGCQWMPLL